MDELRNNILSRITAVAVGLISLREHLHATTATATIDELTILSLSLRRLDGQVERLRDLLPPVETTEAP